MMVDDGDDTGCDCYGEDGDGADDCGYGNDD